MPEISIPLQALFRGSSESARPDRRGLPEAQVERLRELLVRYQQPNPFKPGDLVTPRADALLKGSGDPHIVLEVIERTMPSFRSDACCAEKRFDMRVGCLDRDGDLPTNWVEAFAMEPWRPS